MTALAMLLAVTAFVPAASAGAPAAQALQEARSGERSCSSLSRADFDRIGELTMRRMVGSSAAHESMDVLMGGCSG